MATVCAGSTGTRIESCVGIDGNGDGDVPDDDLTSSQIRTLSSSFATYIQNNSGRDLSGASAEVVGPENDKKRFIRAVSQFVGDSMGGGGGIVIQMGDSGLLRWASGNSSLDSDTRGVWIRERKMIGINTDAETTFSHAGNAARTLIHEQLHSRYPGAEFSSATHQWLDGEARRLLRVYGLADGGCEAIGGFLGYFESYPACR